MCKFYVDTHAITNRRNRGRRVARARHGVRVHRDRDVIFILGEAATAGAGAAAVAQRGGEDPSRSAHAIVGCAPLGTPAIVHLPLEGDDFS